MPRTADEQHVSDRYLIAKPAPTTERRMARPTQQRGGLRSAARWCGAVAVNIVLALATVSAAATPQEPSIDRAAPVEAIRTSTAAWATMPPAAPEAGSDPNNVLLILAAIPGAAYYVPVGIAALYYGVWLFLAPIFLAAVGGLPPLDGTPALALLPVVGPLLATEIISGRGRHPSPGLFGDSPAIQRGAQIVAVAQGVALALVIAAFLVGEPAEESTPALTWQLAPIVTPSSSGFGFSLSW